MRKIKLKFNSTKLKALFLCAVASVGLFYSCNQDDLHHHNHEHQSNFSAKKLSPEEALQVARKLNGLVNKGKHNTLLISEQSLSVANNSVDFSTVNLIESINGTKTYAFAVNDSNLEDNIIKNVILQEFPNEIVVKEVSYNMTESFKQQYYNGATDFKSFQGTVTFETVFGNPCPDDADPVSIGIPVGDDNDGNGGSGYGGYIPIGGFPDGGINNGGLFNSIGGGGSGGGGGGYAYLQCTNCSRTYTSRSEMDGSICAGYNYIIVISFAQNENVVPNNSPCDPSTTLPVAEIEFVTKAREFQRNLTPEQRTWTQQNPTSYTQILTYLRNENWSDESEEFAEELMDLANNEEDEELIPNLINLSIVTKQNRYFENSFDTNYYNLINPYTEVDTQAYNPLWSVYFTTQCAIARYKLSQEPEWNNLYGWQQDAWVYWEASKEMLHLGLDLIGLVPVVGEVADLTNGVIYTIEGDGVNATLSFASTIPIAGWFSAGVKFAKRADGLAYTVKAANNLISFGAYNSKKFRQACGIAIGDATKQAHHIIPRGSQIIEHEVVQRAAKATTNQGFHIDQALNGIAVATWRNQPNHHQYNNKIYDKLQFYIQQNPNATPTQCYNQLMIILNQAKQAIINNPNVHLNNLNF